MALWAHEREIREIKQQLETDVLIYDEQIKDRVYQALTGADHKQKRVAALKAVAGELIKDSLPGCNRICDASDKTLSHSVLRFSSKHKSPALNKQWKFTLALGVSATREIKEAVGELAAHGGVQGRALLRRPLPVVGSLVQSLCENELPPGKGPKAKGKGKGKDKDKGKGKNQDRAKSGGKGYGNSKGRGNGDGGKGGAPSGGSTGPWDAWAQAAWPAPAGAPPSGTVTARAPASSGNAALPPPPPAAPLAATFPGPPAATDSTAAVKAPPPYAAFPGTLLAAPVPGENDELPDFDADAIDPDNKTDEEPEMQVDPALKKRDNPTQEEDKPKKKSKSPEPERSQA